MNIAIYNGDAKCTQQMIRIIEGINNEFGKKFDYLEFESFNSLLNSEWHFDVAILDMDELKDYKLLQELCKAHSHLIIIIVSSDSECLDSAFEIGAFRFFSKPLDEVRFINALICAKNKLQSSKAYVYINNIYGCNKVYFDDIIYIEISNRKTIVITTNSVYYSNNNMAFWRELLLDNDFAVPHNSYLVNLNYITSYKKHRFVVLDNNHHISISRTKGVAFDDKYQAYLKSNRILA